MMCKKKHVKRLSSFTTELFLFHKKCEFFRQYTKLHTLAPTQKDGRAILTQRLFHDAATMSILHLPKIHNNHRSHRVPLLTRLF
jgi:hypothetical protein